MILDLETNDFTFIYLNEVMIKSIINEQAGNNSHENHCTFGNLNSHLFKVSPCYLCAFQKGL